MRGVDGGSVVGDLVHGGSLVQIVDLVGLRIGEGIDMSCGIEIDWAKFTPPIASFAARKRLYLAERIFLAARAVQTRFKVGRDAARKNRGSL
jgi:hypothetical protein